MISLTNKRKYYRSRGRAHLEFRRGRTSDSIRKLNVESGRAKIQRDGAGMPGGLEHTQDAGLPGRVFIYRHNRSPILVLAPETRNVLRTLPAIRSWDPILERDVKQSRRCAIATTSNHSRHRHASYVHVGARTFQYATAQRTFRLRNPRQEVIPPSTSRSRLQGDRREVTMKNLCSEGKSSKSPVQ